MTLTKRAKDQLIRVLFGKSSVPRGLFELGQYISIYGPINFRYENSDNGNVVAISDNFRYGSIVTSGKDADELDRNIKDAILTSFDIPSSYAKEAGIKKVGDKREAYALA